MTLRRPRIAVVPMPLLALLLAMLTACIPQPPVNRDGSTPLPTQPEVDVERYLGLWYEIARFPNSFEEGCVKVTARYEKRPDGTLSVTNTCFAELEDSAPRDVARGRAKIVNEANSKLKVSFFGPFYGDYWILRVNESYTYALVGEPEGRYLWLLARAPRISDALRQEAVALLKDWGYNTDALYWTPQPEGATLFHDGEIRHMAARAGAARLAHRALPGRLN